MEIVLVHPSVSSLDLGTSMLTDSSKLINLYGIARLSDNRADYILCLSEQIGVDGKRY